MKKKVISSSRVTHHTPDGLRVEIVERYVLWTGKEPHNWGWKSVGSPPRSSIPVRRTKLKKAG